MTITLIRFGWLLVAVAVSGCSRAAPPTAPPDDPPIEAAASLHSQLEEFWANNPRVRRAHEEYYRQEVAPARGLQFFELAVFVARTPHDRLHRDLLMLILGPPDRISGSRAIYDYDRGEHGRWRLNIIYTDEGHVAQIGMNSVAGQNRNVVE